MTVPTLLPFYMKDNFGEFKITVLVHTRKPIYFGDLSFNLVLSTILVREEHFYYKTIKQHTGEIIYQGPGKKKKIKPFSV